MKNWVLVTFLFFSANIYAGELVLTENSLGPLKLSEQSTISAKSLKELFPKYDIEYFIGQGDSPDFHYFQVQEKSGETLFSITTYIKNESQRTNADVKIELLVIHSSSIKDQYGIRIGMTYSEVSKLRGKGLKFGANHMDNYIGSGKIWYAFASSKKNKQYGFHLNPEEITINDIKNENSKVKAISWPKPRWE